MKFIRIRSFAVFIIIFFILGCDTEVGYQPPIIPIRISADLHGDIKLSSTYQINTPIGIFDISSSQNILSLRNLANEKLLIVQIDNIATIYQLEEGMEFEVEFVGEGTLYERVSLTYESDGDIILKLRSLPIRETSQIEIPTATLSALVLEQTSNNILSTMPTPTLIPPIPDESLVPIEGVSIIEPLSGYITWYHEQDVFGMNADGSGQLNLTKDMPLRELCDEQDIQSISASPNREFILIGFYCHWIGEAAYGNDIYRISYTNSQSWTRLTRNGVSTFPMWSPNGAHIAYYRYLGPDEGLYLMSANGGNKELLVPGTSFSIHTWSPDSANLLYKKDNEVYILNMNTGASSLIPALSDIDNLSWSPDNNYLAGSFNGQIVLVNLDGTIIRTLTQRGSNYNPTWSPDGKYIAFSSNRDGNSEIYAISIDGLNEQRLTNNSTYDCCPIWTP